MDRFWDLLERSIIVQGLVTLLFVTTVCVMVATGKTVPQEMWIALGVVLGFWFGTKAQHEINLRANRRS